MCIANGVFIGGFEQGSGMGDTQRRSGTQKEDERRVACKETVSVWDHWWQSIPRGHRWREQTCGEVVRGREGPRMGTKKGKFQGSGGSCPPFAAKNERGHSMATGITGVSLSASLKYIDFGADVGGLVCARGSYQGCPW